MSEYAEIIYYENNNIECVRCRNEHDFNLMIDIIKQNCAAQHILVLDLHNVTDLYPINANISNNQICVLSFVGRFSETRNIARTDISNRILNSKVKMGILVFERPKTKTIENSKSVNDVKGTKAWIISTMNDCLENKHFYFVDDSDDHIILTEKHLKSLGNIHCFLVNGTLECVKNTIKTIDKQIEKHL